MNFIKKYPVLADCILVALLSIPAILSLLYPGYFSMHDDQHIVRLFLFDNAIKEGTIYPRWVDGLGFGFGYPLFNFYPPLIYFISEAFHLIGFSLIWSVKLMLITGFITAAAGMYLLVKRLYNWQAGIISSVLYTYFFYHAVTIYVRGAFAEYFSLSILPFLFLGFVQLYKNAKLGTALWTGIVFMLLILCHPLIAFPTVIYIGAFFIFLILQLEKEKRLSYFLHFGLSIAVGLGLSAFFWLPSVLEKKFTYVDEILTHELANYQIHFIQPSQFWQSLWGYGGSGPGFQDGFTFQLGKIHIFLSVIAIAISFFVYSLQVKKREREVFNLFFIGLFIFSMFMTIDVSKFIWDSVSFLWYLQFPWRFLTFVAIFISILGGIVFSYVFYLSERLENSLVRTVAFLFLFVTIVTTIFVYGKYFHPQEYRKVTDADLTTKSEVSWRISRTSFEFVPKGVATAKSELGTTILAIGPSDIPDHPFKLTKGKALIEPEILHSSYKSFYARVGQPVTFQLNTFNFPGWEAKVVNVGENKEVALPIQDNNPYKLITVELPEGEYVLSFEFTDTPVRFTANIISLITVLIIALITWKSDFFGLLLLGKLKKV